MRGHGYLVGALCAWLAVQATVRGEEKPQPPTETNGWSDLPDRPSRLWSIKNLFNRAATARKTPGAAEKPALEQTPLPKQIVMAAESISQAEPAAAAPTVPPAACTAAGTPCGQWNWPKLENFFGRFGCATPACAPSAATAAGPVCGLQRPSLNHLFARSVDGTAYGASCGACGTQHGLCKKGPCEPVSCAYSHLFMPLEVYTRVGPSFVLSGGELGDNIRTGVAVDAAVRGFLYDNGFRSACRGDIGFFYEYNDGDPDPAAPFTLLGTHRYGLFVAGGKEWYGAAGADGTRWKVGGDVGARFGHIKANILDEEDHITDRYYGVFVGGDAGLLLPRCGFDIMLDGRIEWGHDFFGDDRLADDIGHLKLMLSLGLRY